MDKQVKQALEERVRQAEERAVQAEERLRQLEEQVAKLPREYHTLHGSKSLRSFSTD